MRKTLYERLLLNRVTPSATNTPQKKENNMKDVLTGFIRSSQLMLEADRVSVNFPTNTITSSAVLPAKSTLRESHRCYPSIIQSECGKWRVIRCVDDMQNIVQRWQSPYWRSRSYHVEANSILYHYSNDEAFNDIPEPL